MKRVIIFLVCFALVYVPFMWTFSFESVNGTSMLPTYNNHDLLVINRRAPVNRNDIVIIYSRDANVTLVKRVIGIPGDTVEIRDGHVFRNGKLLQEDYIFEKNWTGNFPETIVRLGEVYVLGDNRNASTDSRNLGCMTTEEIKGVSVFNLTKVFGVRFEHLIIIIVVLLILVVLGYLFSLRRIKKLDVEDEESEVEEPIMESFENSWFD